MPEPHTRSDRRGGQAIAMITALCGVILVAVLIHPLLSGIGVLVNETTTTGEVVAEDVDDRITAFGSRDAHLVEVEFTAEDGRTHHFWDENPAKVGETVTVHYDVTDPAHAGTASPWRSVIGAGLGTVIGLGMLVGGGLVVRWLKTPGRRVRPRR
jgi:hypothetical protein